MDWSIPLICRPLRPLDNTQTAALLSHRLVQRWQTRGHGGPFSGSPRRLEPHACLTFGSFHHLSSLFGQTPEKYSQRRQNQIRARKGTSVLPCLRCFRCLSWCSGVIGRIFRLVKSARDADHPTGESGLFEFHFWSVIQGVIDGGALLAIWQQDRKVSRGIWQYAPNILCSHISWWQNAYIVSTIIPRRQNKIAATTVLYTLPSGSHGCQYYLLK